jgi:hypothetical protein
MSWEIQCNEKVIRGEEMLCGEWVDLWVGACGQDVRGAEDVIRTRFVIVIARGNTCNVSVMRENIGVIWYG